MMRRMSKRLARRAAAASSISVSPVDGVVGPRKGCGWSVSDIACCLLDEDDVQGHDEHQRADRKYRGRAEPGLVAHYRVALLLGPLDAPDQTAQLVVRLGLGDQRDAD